MSEESKICSKCGRELPLDRFEVLTKENGKTYHINMCKDCRHEYRQALKREERRVRFYDNLEILIKRSYKEIHSARILDISGMDIIPLGTDEIFVKMMDYKDLWISNYGRAISKTSNKYKLMNGHYDAYGALQYRVRKEVFCNGRFTFVPISLSAAKAVVQEFIVNPDCKNYTYIWHSGNNKEDHYYRNLYPLYKDQYFVVKRHFSETGDDSENFIVKVMNEIRYKPDDWSRRSMIPTINGIGYAGSEDIDRKEISYLRWSDMIHRCYNEKFHERNPQYEGCRVDEEWLNYSNFKLWYNEHFYLLEDEQMDLDKDILCKGNKVYSASTCCIVPHCINTLILSRKANRGQYPIGVYFDKDKDKFRASMNYRGIPCKLGFFNTAEEAFQRYKTYKEDFIQDIAEQYKGRITKKVYDAMMNWKIEIDD